MSSKDTMGEAVLDSICMQPDKVVHIKNVLGKSIEVHYEIFALNYIVLALVMLMSIIALISKLDESMSDRQEFFCKLKYIGIFSCASLGLFYPIKFGLLGLNILLLLELCGEAVVNSDWYQAYKKKTHIL